MSFKAHLVTAMEAANPDSGSLVPMLFIGLALTLARMIIAPALS
jgi:hypothetical protein